MTIALTFRCFPVYSPRSAWHQSKRLNVSYCESLPVLQRLTITRSVMSTTTSPGATLPVILINIANRLLNSRFSGQLIVERVHFEGGRRGQKMGQIYGTQEAVVMSRFTRRKFLVGSGGSMLGAACGGCLFSRPGNAATHQSPNSVKLGEAKTYRVRHRAVVDMGTLPFSMLEIWLPVPLIDAEICPEQSVDSLEVTPNSRISFDTHKLARVANRSFGSQGVSQQRRTYVLEASYEVTVRSQVFDLELHTRYGDSHANHKTQYKRDSQYKTYTRSEKKAPANHASIKSMARRLRSSDDSPLKTARTFYDWIIDNVKYEKMKTFGGAISCLQDRCGECSDFSALFVSLCRAAGIPARPVVGYWAYKHNGWHCWAQFMLPDGQWLPVDCQMGGNGFYSRRMHFGRTDNRRVALCKTFDVRLQRPTGTRRESDYLQNGRWWWEAKQLTDKSLRPTGFFEVSGQAVRAANE